MNTRTVGIVAIGLLLLLGCSRHDRHETVASSAQPVTTGPCSFGAPPSGGTVTNVTFTIKAPAGVLPADLAVGTDLGNLTVGVGVRLVEDSGTGFASLSSVEAGARLALGADSVAKSAYSELTGIDVGARTHLYGVAKTAGTVVRGAGVLIDGGVTQNTSLKPLTVVSWNVAFPSLNRGSCDLQPDKTQTIDPGSYGAIAVKSRAHLKLRAGTYYFSSLSVEPMAVVDVDNAAGPVFINVKNAFAWSGSVVETQPAKGNVVFALATTSATSLLSALRGLVVAPSATLTLASSSTGHVGSFFAKSVLVGANLTVRHRPLSSSAVCPGATDCSTLCPCGGGGACQSNSECQAGFTCQAPSGGGAKICSAIVVDDGNPCTADSLAGGTPVHTPLPPGTSCSDANACNGGETCNASAVCVPGTPPPVDDGNPCTTDTCAPASGVTHVAVAAGTSCSNGNACDGAEACNASATCVAGTPPPVDDGNPCTADACDPATGVAHLPVSAGTSCSNGNACDGAEACNASATCVAGTPPPVDDGNPCTADACDPATGVAHLPVSAGTSCSNGNACDGAETCNASGTCVAGTPPPVDDGNPCTTDTCAPASGVTHVAVAAGTSCSNGNACDGAEACNASAACVAGTPPPVDDGNPCTTDTCAPASGVTHVAVAAGTSCSNGNACDGAEACNASAACVAGTPPAVDDGNPCTADACDPATGVAHLPVSAGASCSNGNACDGAETCSASAACVAGTPPAVDDGNPCTADACEPATGVTHTPESGKICETDGNVCNGISGCDGTGACAAGTPPELDDHNACTSDACDPVSGTTHTPVAPGSSCSDGDICNGTETCNGNGGCLAGTPLAVDDGNPCTRDLCDSVAGATHEAVSAGTSCDDSDICTSDDECDADGFCVAGPAVPPDNDGDPCTLRYCDPVMGVHTVTCSPAADSGVTTIDKGYAFLYTGPNPPQTGVAPGAIAPLRAAVVSGRVLDQAGAGISGVTVRVLDAPELGVTTTRTDGTYDMVVNGGGSLVVDFTSEGYLQAQRRVEPAWGGYGATPDVVLVGLDPAVTTVQTDAAVYQFASGSLSTDADGARRATVMFPPGTTATMTLQDGTVVPLENIAVRSTEFTVGPRGLASMPGELPPTSGYTYAAELTADEALDAGATRVDFNQDLALYLDNFLNIPAGTIVPAGFYDRERGQWLPDKDGRVIKVVALLFGVAYLDADGNGNADPDASLEAMGITMGERTALAARYAAGATFWRVPIRHFTPWDCNFPYGPESGACGPGEDCGGAPDPTPPAPDPDPCTRNGSIIECTNQTLRERFPVAGTPFTLDYSSDRVPGFIAASSLKIAVTGSLPLPSSVRSAEVEISIAGRKFTRTFTTAPNQTYTFVWDGKDAFGRRLQGGQVADVRRSYTYEAVYMKPTQLANAFGQVSGVQLTANRARREITLATLSSHVLSGFDAGRTFALGGFSLSAHHVYDPRKNKVFRGDGEEEDPSFDFGNVIATAAGTGSAGLGADGVPATTSALSSPGGVAVGPDGTLYVSDTANARIRRVRADGTVEAFAGGTGPVTPNLIQNPGNELPIPAVNQIPFWTPDVSGNTWTSKTSNPAPFEGSAYFFAGAAQFAVLLQDVDLSPFAAAIDAGGHRFAFEGYVRTAVGQTDTTAFSVAYVAANKTFTYTSFGMGDEVHTEGWHRVADTRIAPPGVRYARVRLVAKRNTSGNTDSYFDGLSLRGIGTGDGAPATGALMVAPRGLAIGPDGSLYIADSGDNRIRRVDPAGIIHTVAGTGTPGNTGDGGPATAALLNGPSAVAVAPDGAVYIADTQNHRIRRVSPSGSISTLAGTGTAGGTGDNAPASAARLNQPQGVAIEPDGSVLIADSGNHELREVGVDGIIRRLAGTGTPGATGDGGLAKLALLNKPTGLFATADGRVIVTDESNQRVRQIAPAGRITTLAGTGAAGSAGDAGPAVAAQLSAPDAVAVAPNGALFIAERTGQRVRRIEAPFPDTGLGEISIPGANEREVYVFTADGRHLRTRHALTGATLFEFGYDSAARLQSVCDFDGNVTTIERAANGQALAIVGPFGQRTELDYDTNGYLAVIRDPLGAETSLGFDPLGLLTSLHDKRGLEHTFDYDPDGRAIFDGDPAGGFQTLARVEDATGSTVTHGTALGRSTVYDMHTIATGGTRRSVTFPSGVQNVSTSLPDGTSSTTFADGTTTQSVATSDPRFGVATPVVSTTTRTPAGRTQTSAATRSVVLSDPRNPFSIVSMVDTFTQNSRTSNVRYDASTHTLTATSPAGRTRARTIDLSGRTIAEQTPGLLPKTFHYDANGRLDSVTQGTRSTTMTFTTSGAAAGYLDGMRQSPTDLKSYTRDALGRVLQETMGAATTTFVWDPLDTLTSVTPPGKPAHGMAYTAVALLQTYSPPAASLPVSSTSYTYDADRMLRTETRPDGEQIVRTPDSAGRVDSVAIPSGLLNYDYYAAGASGAGKTSDVRGPYDTDLHLTYDGTLTTGMAWSGAVVGNVTFSYNNDFKQTLETVTGSTGSAQAAFGYDADLLLTCASPTTCNPAGADALKLVRSPQHGLVASITLGNTSETLTYNGFGELARQTASFSPSTPLVDIAYDAPGAEHDALGRIVVKTEIIGDATKTFAYAYDARRRLTDVTVSGTLAEHFEYDGNGNRTLGFDAATSTTSVGSYDDQDRLLAYGPFDFTYTPNGDIETQTNRETGQASLFQYDVLGNLLSVGLPNGDLVEYLVDGLGRRIGKKKNGVLIRQWLYRDPLAPAAELDGAGALVSEFVYGSKSNVPDYVRRGGSTYRVITDQLGSPRYVVNVANASDVPFSASYTSFGAVTGTGLDWMPFGFAGGTYDPDTQLLRFGARDYDPTVGRWLRKDPIRFDGHQTNLYVYTGNDPVNGTDPSGLTDWHVAGGKCCNRTNRTEYGITGSGQLVTLERDQCTGWNDDCDGMTCGGGFYKLPGLVRDMRCRDDGVEDNSGDDPDDRRWSPLCPATGDPYQQSPSEVSGENGGGDQPDPLIDYGWNDPSHDQWHPPLLP